jgi:sugar/nucleoside kinase (ribokinase family)
LIKKADVVALEDPQHGVMPKALVQKLIALTRKSRVPMFVDPQVGHRPPNHHFYKGVHTMFLNDKEARSVDPQFNDSNLIDSLRRIQKKFKLQNVVVKLGDRGSAALVGKEYMEVPVHKIKAVDPVGAGCSYLAAAALGDLESAEETLKIASIWAALSTTIVGTTPPKKKELLKIVNRAGAW